MWNCPSCKAQNTDSANNCHHCATPRKHPNPDARPALNYATAGRRFGAMFLDFGPAILITTFVQILAIRGDVDWLNFLALERSGSSILSVIFLIAVYVGSLTFSIQLFGRTLGKYFLSLRVVDESGAPATKFQMMKYELAAPFSLDLVLRYHSLKWGDRRRIWADRLVGTALIHGKPPEPLDPDPPAPDPPDDDMYSEGFR